MALQEQTISLNFGQGLDTKTDPKMLVPAKLALLQDGIFTNSKRASKRNGYSKMTNAIVGGGTWSSPTMDRNYNNEMVLAATGSSGQRLYSYSSSLNAWNDQGKYVSVGVSKKIIASPSLGPSNTSPVGEFGVINCSSATIGNITVYGYDNGGQLIANSLPFAGTAVNWAVYDNTTGQRLIGSQIVSPYGFTWGFSKVIALSASRFAIFYISDTDPSSSTAPELFFQTITVTSGSGAVVGSETFVSPAFVSTGSTSAANSYSYDAVSTPGGCIVAICAPNGGSREVYIATYNTTGSFQNSTTATVGATSVTALNIILDPSATNAWIYWHLTNDSINYSIFNASTLSSVLATTIIATITNVQQLTAIAIDATHQVAYWSVWTQPGLTIGVYYPIISSAAVTSVGSVGSPLIFKNGLDIYSKPFSLGGRNYLPCVNLSQSQSTGFLIDLSDGITVSKFLQTSAEGIYSAFGDVAGSTYVAPSPISVRYPGFLNPSTLITAKIAMIPAGFLVSLTEAVQISSANKAAFPSLVTINAQMGVASILFDFDNVDANQSLIQQDTLVLNGGIVSQYDGTSVTELGFNIDPDAVSLGSTVTSGGMGSGKFIYYAVYQWTDGNGNLHQSAPSLPSVIVFTSGTTNSAQISVAPLTLTQKTNVVINIYRTIANGTIAYLVGAIINSSSYTSSHFLDLTADADIQTNPTLYTEGGAILENIAPPPAMIMWTNYNRVWCVDSENPETTYEYCKTASKGSGISFSTGNLEGVIDSRGGVISGVSPMDEKTVFLKKSAIGYQIGDGANDAGTGSQISPFQFIPSDTGCTNSKSVILFPDGILFKSPKGIYIVTRGAQIGYFGTEVEAYNGQDVQSAILTGNRNQIRFLTSSGVSLLYDYVFKQWSVFTNHQGLSADVWQGNYIYVRTDGNLYQENPTSFLDDTASYPLLATTAWIKAASIQNFQRLRRISMLGDYQTAGGHGVQISAYYDWSSNAVSVVPFTFDGLTPFFQYRERLSEQKCDSLQLTIQEIVTGASGEYIDFNDLGLEIGAKKGLRKLPASQSVG